MGAYNAVKLIEKFTVSTLILFVPAAYTPEAYSIPFGSGFSNVIRANKSWESSDAYQIISSFTGRLLIVTAEYDDVIPREIPERLYSYAVNASKKEMYEVRGSPHQILKYLEDNKAESEILSKNIVKIVQGL